MKILKMIPFLVALAASLESSAATGSELKTAINPSHLANTTQYGYSQAVAVSPNARTIYVAGQIGISETGPNDFKSQVDRSFENLLAALEAGGATAADVVKITLLIKDHDGGKLRYLVEKRRAVFGSNPPASTLIPVTALALDLIAFEIDAIAVVPATQTK